MSVKITIHRGTDQIGGSITEIATEKTCLFIDFGAELSREEEKPADWEMVSMMKYALKAGKCDAILFTHIHGDHIGLLDRIPEIEEYGGRTVQLGMGVNAWQCYRNIHETLKNIPAKSNKDTVAKEKHERIVNILDRADLKKFKNRVSFKIGDITVTPVSVDHSAFDSYMFIIEAEGKCIVHTGDFRTHGRLGENFFDKLSGYLGDRSVDVLLTEGTMMSRLSENELTEAKMEIKAGEELAKPKNKCTFLLCSSTNVESLASFYNAMMTANNKEKKYKNRKFYVNSYAAKQLELYRNTLGQTNDKFKFDENIESFDKLTSELKPKISQMKEDGFVMLITNPTNYLRFIGDVKDENTLLIYSQWSEYLGNEVKENKEKDEPYVNREHLELFKLFENRCILHTAGHAYKDDIEKMIRTVNPKEAIIPIHTERKEDFKKLEIDKDLQDRVAVMSDGDSYVLGKGKESFYQAIADKAAAELDKEENSGWKKRYRTYCSDISEAEEYVETVCQCFDGELEPLTKYTSVGRVQKTKTGPRGHGIVSIDLRAWGISVAELVVKTDDFKQDIKGKHHDKSEIRKKAEITFRRNAVDKIEELLSESEKEKYRTKDLFTGEKTPEGDSREPRKIGWDTSDFTNFVKPFINSLKGMTLVKYEEHPVETRLLSILDDEKKRPEALKKLVLCKLAGQFYQICTPLAASEAKYGKVEYSKDDQGRDRRGGGIDILAYTNTDKKQLCVIELKDTYDPKESPEKAINQAIAYATFIIKLLRSESGKEWYNQFGLESSLPDELTVNAVIAMPCPDQKKHIDFAGKKLNVGEDIIKLHYLYFNKIGQNELKEFKTSLFDKE